MISKNNIGGTVLIGSLVVVSVAWSSLAVAHGWKAPEEAVNMKNPITVSERSVESGRELFRENCAYCHGAGAKGMDAKAAGLDTSPPDLTQRLKEHTQGDLFWKIRTGKGDMPSFKDILDSEKIWNVLNFLNTLK